MSIRHIEAVFAAAISNPTDKLVALAIADFADRDTGRAWPSVASLQSMTSLAERSVQNALRRLEADGHLTVRLGTGKGHPSCYFLHPKGAAGAPIPIQKGESDAPLPPPNPAAAAPFELLNGAPDAPIEPPKGASGAPKGASGAPKGAGDAPEPSLTVKNRQGRSVLPAARATLPEVLIFVKSLSLPDSDGEWFFHKCEGNGWRNSGQPIKDWKATVRAWKAGGYLPSQKSSGYARQGPAAAPAQKKEARPPDQLAALFALLREDYPGLSAERWEDIPFAIRQAAERRLASNPPPENLILT